MANAENNENLNPDDLVIIEATVGEGPTMKRFQPRARGSSGRIRKRTSHIRVIVSDEVPLKFTLERLDKKTRSKKNKKPENKQVALEEEQQAPDTQSAAE